jgi:hypothetical protein
LNDNWFKGKTTVLLDKEFTVGALKNLASFKADEKLKKATYAFIAS